VSKQNLNQRAIAVALSPSKYGFSFSIATLIDSDNHNDIKIIMFFFNVSNILRLTIPSYINKRTVPLSLWFVFIDQMREHVRILYTIIFKYYVIIARVS